MASPYLKSGESIVLTTDRVSVDSVLYDIMLTTERIFLIDERSARFEPRILPLVSLVSVRGGMTPAQDPVIILLFQARDSTGEQQTVNLVFSQIKNENRMPERDDWVRNLLELSVSHDEKESPAETPVVPKPAGVTGLHPTARHGVAPDKVRPLSDVGSRQPLQSRVTVIPDEGEIGRERPVPAAVARVPASGEDSTVDALPEEPPAEYLPEQETAPAVTAAPVRIIIPQIIEELLPVKKTAAPPEEKAPLLPAEYDRDALFRTIPVASRSMTVTEEQARQPAGPSGNAPVAEPAVHVPDIPVHKTVPAPEAEFPESFFAEEKEIPEIIRALHSGAVEQDTTEPSGAALSGSVPEPVPPDAETDIRGAPEPDISPALPDTAVPEPVGDLIPEAGPREAPESPGSLIVTEDMIQDSFGHHEPLTGLREETPATAARPVRHPIPPAREIRPLRTTIICAAALLLVLVLVAAGILLLLPQGTGGQAETLPTPAPTTEPVTTLPPETFPPATLPPAATPVITTLRTPVAPVPAPTVPPAGVWVRVNCTAEYFGTVGNTELTQKVSGTGENYYKVLGSDRPVQVSLQKNDNSGAVLSVTIYRDGIPITTRSVTSPMGEISLLIDPDTGKPPGLTANETVVPATTTFHLENY